jgi:GNAT superfamily N-acetyltransferase
MMLIDDPDQIRAWLPLLLADPWVGRVSWQGTRREFGTDRGHQVYLEDGVAVGLVTPHTQGRWLRIGPIWVAPEHRGRGVGVRMIVHAVEGRACMAWIHRDNHASQAAYTRAGFRRIRPSGCGALWTYTPTTPGPPLIL